MSTANPNITAAMCWASLALTPTYTLTSVESQLSTQDLRAWLLPLLAGGGWEGVELLFFFAKSNPTSSLSCAQGRERFEASL